MHQTGLALLRDAIDQMVVHCHQVRAFSGFRCLELAHPTAKLASDVVLFAAELTEPNSVDIYGVDSGQDFDQRLSHAS